jgi:hypothetical protein
LHVDGRSRHHGWSMDTASGDAVMDRIKAVIPDALDRPGASRSHEGM